MKSQLMSRIWMGVRCMMRGRPCEVTMLITSRKDRVRVSTSSELVLRWCEHQCHTEGVFRMRVKVW